MERLTKELALQSVKHAEIVNLTPEDVKPLVGELCEMVVVTAVKTAAAHKDVVIHKVSKSDVLLPKDGDVYRQMVKESALENGSEAANVDAFEVGESPYRHTDIYPVCELKSNPEKKYLYAIYKNTSNSVYIKDGEELTKEQVAEYLTASEARKLLEEKTSVTENVTHNIKHTVIVRTIGLGGIVSLNKKGNLI